MLRGGKGGDKHRQGDWCNRGRPTAVARTVEGAHTARTGEDSITVAIPDRAEPIAGWRAWKVTPDGSLSAITRDVLWPKGKAAEAWCSDCTPKGIRVPNPEHGGDNDRGAHGCGIYALKREVKPEEAAWGEVGAIGPVALWGRVILAEHGYRAEFAYPLRLIVPGVTPVLAVRGLEGYGVPIDVVDIPSPMVVNPPPVFAPAVSPRRTHNLPVRTQWFQLGMLFPNTHFRQQMPLGLQYLQILLAAAQDTIDRVELVINGAFQVSDIPLARCLRDSAGNYLIYDGIPAGGVVIDTTKAATLEIVVHTTGSNWSATPLLVGYVAL